MAQKVFTLNINENLATQKTASTKSTNKVDKNASLEEFGVAEINNSSAKKRVSTKQELGYSKNVSNTTKKSIKPKVQEVDDYFDFCFKPAKKITESKAVIEKPAQAVKLSESSNKKVVQNKIKSEKKVENCVKKTASASKKISQKAKEKTVKPECKAITKKQLTKEVKIITPIIETFEMEETDDEVLNVLRVARLGSLFDYEKGE